MKILNLVYPNQGDIEYVKQKFPDGQQNIVINKDSLNEPNHRKSKPFVVKIYSRLNNWLDLELIVASVASLRKLSVKEIHLYTPYLLGARSDRQFTVGGNSYLVDVLAPIINSLNFESVTVMDAHSDVAAACIKNLKNISNWNIVDFFFESNLNDANYLLISPDAGALKKVSNIADILAYKREIIVCSKSRDKDGKLSQTQVPIQFGETRDIIIIDDICDGGATFENISAALNDADHKGKKYLIITHGIFSKGFTNLSRCFDGIYCTNSYSDIEPPLNYTDTHLYIIDKVNQLNVFING